MQQIVVLPTVEYEVYHGRNFVDASAMLFEPTQRVLERASGAGIPFTLFPDVCCVWAYRKQGMDQFADRFEAQLVDALKSGHDAQLHVHAHWSRAYYEEGEWRLRDLTISLADLDFTTKLPETMIRDGVDYLEHLLQPHMPSYRCIAFRAGGLLLEPRERITQILRECGVAIDSSIAKDYCVRHDALRVDHRGMPAAANWDLGHGVYEIPLVTFGMSAFERARFLLRRLGRANKRRGTPISRAKRQTPAANMLTLVQQNARYLGTNPMFLFSADTKGFTRRMLVEGFKDYVRRHEDAFGPPIYVSMINHPKLMFAEEEDLLFDVLAELREYYGERLTFATFTSVARELDLVPA